MKDDELRKYVEDDLLAHEAFTKEAKHLISDVLSQKMTFDSEFGSFDECTDDSHKHLPFGQFLHHFCLPGKYLERYREFFNLLYQRVEVKVRVRSKMFDNIWLYIINKTSEKDGRLRETPLTVTKITLAHLLPILIIDYLEDFTGYYKDREMVVNGCSVSLGNIKSKLDTNGLYPFLSLLINACDVGVLKDGVTYGNIDEVFIPVTDIDSTHELKGSFYYLFRICTLTSIDRSDMKQLSRTINDARIMPNLQHFLCNFVKHVLKCTSISTKKDNAYAPKNYFYPRRTPATRTEYLDKKDLKTLIPVKNYIKRVATKKITMLCKTR